MAKKTKTTAVATTAKTSTDVIGQTDLQQKIGQAKSRLAALRETTDEKVSTNVDFETMGGDSIKISDVETLTELIEIQHSVDAQAEGFKVAAEKLGLTGKVNQWKNGNFNQEQWSEILKKAVIELKNKKEIKLLEESIKALSEFLDEETKKEQALAQIMAKYETLLHD